MTIQDKLKLFKLELEARRREIQISKKNASDFNLRKSYLVGRHFEVNEILKSLKTVK